MPFFPEGQDPLNPSGNEQRWPTGPVDAPKPFAVPPTFGETLNAAFLQNNPIASVLGVLSKSSPSNEVTPGYNAVPGLMGSKYEPQISQFYGDTNEAQTMARKAAIDGEDANRQTLGASGWAGTVAGVVSGVFDPFNFIPIAGEFNMARGAVQGAGIALASEAALHASQDSRTWQESVGNVASSAILMGVLGGAHAMLNPAERVAAAGALDEVRPKVAADPVTGEVRTVNDNGLPPGVKADAGAAATDTRTLDPKSYGLDKIPGANKVSPNLRVYFGDSIEAKRIASEISETAIRFKQHDEGVPTSLNGPPLESIVRQQSNQLMTATHDILEEAWAKQYYGAEKPGAVRLAAGREGIGAPTVGDKLSFSDFKSAVYDAGVNGDKHPNQFVQEAIQKLRSQVMDPIKTFAQETKTLDGQPMLNEELDAPAGDASFMPRQYNRQAAIAKHGEFVDKTTDWLAAEDLRKAEIRDRLEGLQKNHDALGENDAAEKAAIRAQIETEIKSWGGKTTADAIKALKARDKANLTSATPSTAGNAAVDNAVRSILGNNKLGMSRQELKSLATEIVDRIVSSPDGRIPYDAPSGGPKIGAPDGQPVRAALNSRDFAMPTSMFPTGVINKDIEHVMAAHVRTMIPDIHLTARFGDLEMKNEFKKVQEEFAAKAEGKTEKEATALYKQRDGLIQDLAAMRDRLRNVYGWNPDPFSRKAGAIIRDFQNWTALTSLGTSVINRLGDLGANAVFRYGLQNVFSDIWKPFFTGLLHLSPELTMAKSEAKAMGIGVEGLLGHMRHNLHDVVDSYQAGNRFSRGLAWATDKSMLVNGHGPWTDYMKAMTVNAAQRQFAVTAERVAKGTATKADLQRLADANISQPMAEKIHAQYSSYHTDVEGAKFANTAAWTDKAARQTFEAAMSREANISVVTAGVGDKPLWLSKPAGALIGQFKSFAAGSHEKILISNLQQRDGRTLQGVLTAMAMGVLSYRLYTLASGQQASSNPADWIKEALHRSALTGWLGEANQVASKFTGGAADYNRAYGATAPLSRRRDISLGGELLGPTYSRVEGLANIVHNVSVGKGSATDIHQARLALPLQNLMGLRILLDQVEAGTAEALGAKPLPPH